MKLELKLIFLERCVLKLESEERFDFCFYESERERYSPSYVRFESISGNPHSRPILPNAARKIQSFEI